MLSKLRGQLDEMKSKVQFLGLVKKYLQASSPLSLPFFQNEHQASDGVPSVILWIKTHEVMHTGPG